MKFFRSFVIFHLITAFIIYYSLGVFIKTFSRNYTLSYVIFFGMGHFFNSMNQHRQYLAFAVCLWGVIFLLKENNIKKFLIASFCALFIHNISFVLIASCIMAYMLKRIKAAHLAIIFMGVGISYLIVERAITIFARVFPIYKIYFNEWVRLFEGKSDYLDWILILLLTIVEVSYFVSLEQMRKSRKNRRENKFLSDKYKNFLLIINAVNISAKIISTKIYLITRVSLVADPFLMNMIPDMIDQFKLKAESKRILYEVMGVLLFVYMFMLLRRDGSGVAAYKLFLINNQYKYY